MKQNTATVKKIWCVYNHVPGGQIIATHFSTYTRKKRTGPDSSEDILFRAEDQLVAFKKSHFVGLKMRGVDFKKNEVLVYPENLFLPDDPADTVIAWALEQGVEPYKTPSEQTGSKKGESVADPEQQKEIESLKKDIAGLKEGQQKTEKGIQDILQLLNAKKGGE